MVDTAADDIQLFTGDTQRKQQLIASFHRPALLLLLINRDAAKRCERQARGRGPGRKS